MEAGIRTELEKLNGNLERIFDKIEVIDQDVKGLSTDVKEIKSDVAGQGREIAELKTGLSHNNAEIIKLHAEDKDLWGHFPAQKDDIKEFVGIKFKEATAINEKKNEKVKNWVITAGVTALVSFIGALISIIKFFNGGVR